MAKLLFLLLMLSDVVLATSVFIALAKPDVAIGFAIRRMGLNEPWFEEHVREDELARLRHITRMFSLGGLAAVFAWSFLVGSLMRLMGV